MTYIKIAYVNYWNDPYNDKYLSMFIKHNFNCDIINVNCHDNPDILIASVCGNINIIDSINAKCKIFYYGENLDRYPPYNNIELLKSKFDIIAGFKYTNKKEKIFRFPLWLIYFSFYNFKNEDNIIKYIENKYYENVKKNKTMFATLISRHDRGGQRKLIYNILSNYGNIYCSGNFNNNTNKLGPTQNEKINYISKSIYNICPENSIYEGYTTEKIFQAFEAGTIPLYWGHDLPEKEILNKNKYCFCNIEDNNILKQQIEDVVLNKNKYIEGKIFNENAKNVIETYYNDLINEIKIYI
tara:strand:- start:4226 stop:5119 length:894 start_codon:yes stop_codon:yes gene_type:complete